jgi:hypothetical protein
MRTSQTIRPKLIMRPQAITQNLVVGFRFNPTRKFVPLSGTLYPQSGNVFGGQ